MTDGPSRSHETPPPEPPRVDYPWTVRWMAAFWVVAPAFGMLGFLTFGMLALILYLRHGRSLDWPVMAAWAAAGACPLACAAFRRWFVWWGRRRWPEDPAVGARMDDTRPTGEAGEP